MPDTCVVFVNEAEIVSRANRLRWYPHEAEQQPAATRWTIE